MTYTMPLRLTILHFEQRFLIEDDTFIIKAPLRFHGVTAKSFIILGRPSFVQVSCFAHGSVSTNGPFSVTATLCSK